MESNKIDTLFRNKLERHEETVSSDAWSRVETQLPSHKKYSPVRWYVAASVSIIIIAAFSLFLNQEKGLNDNIAAIKPVELGQSSIAFIDPLETAHQNRPLAQAKEDNTRQKAISDSQVNKKINREIDQSVANNDKGNNETIILPRITNHPSSLFVEVTYDYHSQVISKVNTKIMVEINFNPKKQTEFEQGRNKLKSLASELSIADLRASKNELFASALNFDKKRLN